jgi:hypothetical protein
MLKSGFSGQKFANFARKKIHQFSCKIVLVKQQTHSLWPNQEQLLFYTDYLLIFIQFSYFYQEAIFLGKKYIPQIFANVFQYSKHSQEKKTTDPECCLKFSPQFVMMNKKKNKLSNLQTVFISFFLCFWTPCTFKLYISCSL